MHLDNNTNSEGQKREYCSNGASRGGAKIIKTFSSRNTTQNLGNNRFNNTSNIGAYENNPLIKSGRVSLDKTYNSRTNSKFNNMIPTTYETRDISIVFEEDRQNAKHYDMLEETDDDIIVTGTNCDTPICFKTWEDMELDPRLMENIKKSGYIKPRRIQAFSFPLITAGYDIKGQAETGSGKTAAFLLPIIDKMLKLKFVSMRRTPYALVITPTRELALQIHEQAKKFCLNTPYECAKLYGQLEKSSLNRELDGGCDILIGTPGKLKDFTKNLQINFSKLAFVVIDEADRLLEFNFANDVNEIINSPLCTPISKRQNLLFFATITKELERYSMDWMRKEVATIKNKRENEVNNKIHHNIINVQGLSKNKLVVDLLIDEQKQAEESDLSLRKTLVFVERKKVCNILALMLMNYGIKSASLNGDRLQKDREKAINEFRSGQITVLVATDVAARGIDIFDLDHVIVVDLPKDDFMTYVHRVGRTGRLKKGTATTFYNPETDYDFKDNLIEMLQNLGQDVPDFLQQ
uniref:RNA helicase n=1 Tax=Parastrongyloides trichosuri TaxID=131310 RepID=A0A0N4ZSF8_PARTI